jgi:choloylglycine hydrolase
MVSLMWLNGSEYPPADDRPALGILEWVQFHLDTNATVAEVVATAKSFRPTSKIPIHYIFADASGDAAVIEFLEGKLIVYRGDTMPVKALANSTYADSVAAFKAFKESGTTSAEEAKTRTPPPGFGSLDRFVRGAMLSPAKGDPVAHGFEILSQVKQANTRWSIIYDLNVGEVFFKTDVNPEIRHFTVAGFNYSCGTPVQMLDLTAPGSGQVQTHFADYTTAAVRTLLKNSLKGRPGAFIEKIATNPDLTSACTDGS